MNIPITIIDAFAHKPFTGNPAAVCLLEKEMPDDWMQSIAVEMNLSETAFLLREGDRWRLRWMTPAVEVDLCGHATLASAKYLLTEGIADPSQPILFETRSGTLSATPKGDQITLDLPAIETSPIDSSSILAEALGVTPLGVSRGRFDYLVELESDEVVRNLSPDLHKLRQIEARGVVVTAKASSGRDYDYVCRGFFPQSGIDEDPVTGSAHCMLAPFWAERLGKTTLTGYQASKRGGYVRIELIGDRVKMAGGAIITMKGMLQT